MTTPSIRAALLCIGVITASPATSQSFALCSGSDRAARKVTCLIDGDSGWQAGVKWRLKEVDTPEHAGHADCRQETEYAAAATYRMLELMRGGFTVEWLHEKDRSGERELVRIMLSDGRDAGQVLLAEGHAVVWPHPKGPWCVSTSPRD